MISRQAVARTVFLAGGITLCLSNVSLAAADTAPKLDRSQPLTAPQYSTVSQLAGETGVAQVSVYVNSYGRPTSFKLKRSSGFEDLDNFAIAAALNWRYVPAVRGGEPVSDWASLNIDFQLPNAPAGKQSSHSN